MVNVYGRMIRRYEIGERINGGTFFFGRSLSCSDSWDYLVICLERVKKITNVLVQDSSSPDMHCGPLYRLLSVIITLVSLFTVLHSLVISV